MDQHVKKMLDAFFSAIRPWESAYPSARLNFIAIRRGELLEIVTARVYLSAIFRETPKDWFQSGEIEAGQVPLSGGVATFEQIIEQIASPDGFPISGHGRLRLLVDENQNVTVGPPDLIHAEGISGGNRLAVLTMSGTRRDMLAQQPKTDWMLKAAANPFDSLNELSIEYGLGVAQHISTTLEVVANTAAEVSVGSTVKGGKATLGLWLANSLDRSMARLGYRVIEKGIVVKRGSADGDQLDWKEKSGDVIGELTLDMPLGAVVHCIASYAGHAHHLRWFFDPDMHQNPRMAILSSVDQTGKVLRGYLLPDLPLKSKSADDFESAVTWMLWAMGFAPVSFGMNGKTRDAFDIVAVSPRGDFVVVECTLGLLRAESKLSKLSAREASLRKTLLASGHHHLRVLPIIVTALTKEEVKADLPAAAETGVLVLTREDLESAIDTGRLRFTNPDQLFEESVQKIAETKATRESPLV